MSPQEDERRYALLVATASYRDPKLQQLRAPAADAQRLADVLGDPEKGDFGVEVLIDETQSTVTRKIARFFRDRRPQDLLLLHFSCHGVKDERGELYLAASDTEVDLLSATGVSAAWLNEQITRSRSKRTVVLLDCCFSGSFPFGMRARGGGIVDAPEQLQGRGRVIITASSALEYAYEGDGLHGDGKPSIFTEAVVEGLQTGRADLDGDRWVSVDELYDYVYDRVKESTPSQTPSKKSDLEGPLYLARSSYRPPVEPAALDLPTPAPAAQPAAGRRLDAPARSAPWTPRRARLVLGAAAIAVTGLLVGLLLSSRDPPTDRTPVFNDSPARPAVVPESCTSKGVTTLAKDHGALREWDCTTLYSEAADVTGPSLTYLQFSSPEEAKEDLRSTRRFELRQGYQRCTRASLPEAVCLRSQTGTIEILWYPGATTVTGSTTFDPPTTVPNAVRAWQRVR